MRWAGHVACMGEGRGEYRVLVGKPGGKRKRGRTGKKGGEKVKRGWGGGGWGGGGGV